MSRWTVGRIEDGQLPSSKFIAAALMVIKPQSFKDLFVIGEL